MNKFAAGIITNESGDVLLLRRSWSAPWMDYKYCFPGGEIEADEEPKAALVREIKEEMMLQTDPKDWVEFVKMEEFDGKQKYTTHYFKYIGEGLPETDIVLNYENDKYVFVDLNNYNEDELIPNLDLVLEYIKESKGINSGDVDNIIAKAISDSFNDLLSNNPFYIEKAELHKERLTLKTITDRIGRRVKKWVKTSQPELQQNQQKQQDNQTQDVESKRQESEGINYHSIYKDDAVLSKYAKQTSSNDLANFINKNKNNTNASRLLEIAKQELKDRGEPIPEDGSENPYASVEEQRPKSGLSDAAQEHVDLANIADTTKDIIDYIPEVKNDENLSDDEKQQVISKLYEQIGRLTEKGKTGEKIDKQSDGTEQNRPTGESEKQEPVGKIEKHEDGTYNEETGEGWVGDESLGEEYKVESERVDKMIKDDIRSLVHPQSRVGELIMQTGPGGLGKTYTAVNELKKNGYDEIEIGDKSKKGIKSKNGFVHVKGGMTAASLYEAMHDYPYAVFLIDDAENIFNSAQALEYIKAATDTTKQTVTRALSGDGSTSPETKRENINEQLDNLKQDLGDLRDQIEELESQRDPANNSKIRSLHKKVRDLKTKINIKERELESLGDIRKKQFDFKGKVMMISNKFPEHNKVLWEKMYKPLMSRTTSGQINDLKMSKGAKLYKLSTLIPYFSAGKDSSGAVIAPKNFKERKEVYDFVKKLVQEGRVDDVSTRMLSGVYAQKLRGGDNWKMELLRKYKREGGNLEKAETAIYSHIEYLILGY